MVIVREYKESDFEEVVQMYYNMIIEVYPHREFKAKQFFYNNVIRWIDSNYDIIVTSKDDIITGFALCYFDNMGGICEDYYQGECIYVKPEYRKGRSAYLMYKSVMIYADNSNFLISTNASDITESSHISNKLGIKVFTKYERLPLKKENR
jgi:hypothetical protein